MPEIPQRSSLPPYRGVLSFGWSTGDTGVNRRAFITLIGGAAAAWPLAARAQQPDRMRRIGVLMAYAESDPEGQARLAAFLQELQQLGWVEGRGVRIDVRWGAGDAERIRRYATELVGLTPGSTTPAVAALQQATVTVGTDEVRAGSQPQDREGARSHRAR